MLQLPLVRLDRANHFIWGEAVFMAVALPLRAIGVRGSAARLAAMAVTVAAALIKEWLDRRFNKRHAAEIAAGVVSAHGVERADAAWTIAGGMTLWVGSSFLGD